MKPDEKIQSIRKSIDKQDERVHQHNLDDLRSRYEHISKREAELNDLLSQEKARNRMQELEIDRRQKQLKESTELIRNLQAELEKGWKKARSMSSELREFEFINKAETEIVNLRTKVTGMEARLKRNQMEMGAANDLMKSNSELEIHKELLDKANKELAKHKEMLEEAKKTSLELDNHCEHLMIKLQETNSCKENALSEKRLMKEELESLRKQLTDRFRVQFEFQSLKDKNKLLEYKIKVMERELAEANIDNRKELTKLTDQLVKQQNENSGKSQSYELNETQIRQQNSQIRSYERQLEESIKEVENLAAEINQLRKKETEIMEENELLRQNFTECLQKAETFRDQIKEIAEQSEQLKQEIENDKHKLTSFEDQIFELRSEIEQRDKLIAYLQSVVQPKQMQKLPRPRSSLLSSESDFISDLDLEYKQCQQLEQRRNKMKADLERKEIALVKKENSRNVGEVVPLLKDKTPFKILTKPSALSLKHSCTESTINTAKTPGKMRHDIPHRWKRHFVAINPNRCQVCMEGLPYFRHVYRCRDCEMTVHQHCRQTVVNTCGLPTECADFYLDTHSTSAEQMTGWVKLLDLIPARHLDKWRNAWACIEEHKLSFYENDQLALSDGVPFIQVNLDIEQWRIYNQTAEKPLDGVRGEDMSVLIELRMPNRTILMLTPTVQAKQRWVQALQYATNRRIFIQRRPSSAIVNNMLLLALESPQNLSINCTQILGAEWLLIGAQEGLFATSLQQNQLRAPFQIAGIPKMFWMELLPEFDMLLTICGTNRSLVCIHIQQLHRALKVEKQPAANLTPVSGIEQCHIVELSKPEHNRDKRFVYIATIDSIIILQYIAKLGVFSPVKKFKTEEPCMCICSMPIGFIYGADNFHFISFDNDFSASSQLMVDNCPFDFPVSVVAISDNEYLLAFHNFGLFVDSQGKRTRAKNVEWEKVPMEFVYTAPFLYIVYCEFLEVVRIAPLIGLDSGTLTDDRNMFKCRLAHFTGQGLSPQEVLFVVSSENVVELHSFSHNNNTNGGDQQTSAAVKSILKRKMLETAPAMHSSGTKKKY